MQAYYSQCTISSCRKLLSSMPTLSGRRLQTTLDSVVAFSSAAGSDARSSRKEHSRTQPRPHSQHQQHVRPADTEEYVQVKRRRSGAAPAGHTPGHEEPFYSTHGQEHGAAFASATAAAATSSRNGAQRAYIQGSTGVLPRLQQGLSQDAPRKERRSKPDAEPQQKLFSSSSRAVALASAAAATAAVPVLRQAQGRAQASGLPDTATPASDIKPANSTALKHQSDTRFDSLPVSPLTKRAISEVFGYDFCTKVQAQSLPVCLSGTDVLAKAKTGTGKTLAFMIPALEDLVRSPPRKGQVGVMVLSPTRELAMQIHAETAKLLTFHKMEVQVVIGGTNMNSEVRRLQQNPPHVLVATPGRCLDHLSNSSSGLGGMVKDLRMLVLDEADNILDMGFRPTIEKILRLIPDKSQRQTLLFSATFPGNVKELAKFGMRPDYQIVDTVGEDTGTNVLVEQQSYVARHHELMTYLYHVIQAHMQQDDQFKIIVFFPTARMTQLYSETFQKLNLPVLEMHSRKSQAVRKRMSDQFRSGSSVIMFSSDVSARGVDYPDVGLVIQVGLPTDKSQYVHRVGRTARAGKTGESVLLLADFESFFLNKLTDLPVQRMPALPDSVMAAAAPLMSKALSQVSLDTKSKAYAAWLGFYKSAPGLSMAASKVVQTANEFSKIIGCLEPPELEASTVGKMGLKGVPGLRIMGKGQRPGRG